MEVKSNICAEVSPDEIGKLTNSTDDRLVKVIERRGRYINEDVTDHINGYFLKYLL